MQQKSELPEGWTLTELPSVAFFQEGPGLRKFQFCDDGIPFLNIRTMVNERIDLSKCKYLNPSEVQAKYGHFLLDEDDLILSSSGSIGKTARICKEDLPLMLNTSVIRFRTLNKNILSNDFLYLFLKSDFLYKQIESMKTGTAQYNFGPTHLKQMLFSLPPLAEQHSIVKATGVLFARLDAINEKLGRVPEILKTFRQAVLVAACDGGLTESWRLSNSIDKSTNWKWQNISEIGVVSGGLIKNQKRMMYSLSLPYLRVANVYANRLDLSEIKEIGVLENELSRFLLQEGDLLVVEGNGSIDQIGRVALWDGSISPCIHQNHIIKVRFYQGIYNRYVLYWLLSPIGRDKIVQSSSSTSGLNTLSISKVGQLPIPVPPLPEQQEIVRRVDALFAFADSVEAKVAAAREKTERLRQSILAKAFSGKLVPTEAEIARQEGRGYESAGELVGRIGKEGKVSAK
jgi:type I restriction enzyme S subunit